MAGSDQPGGDLVRRSQQGALGAATHMARLVPQQMMRALYFTAAAEELGYDAQVINVELDSNLAVSAVSESVRPAAGSMTYGV